MPIIKSVKKAGTYKITSELRDLIESKLYKIWSPEQIAERELQFIIKKNKNPKIFYLEAFFIFSSYIE